MKRLLLFLFVIGLGALLAVPAAAQEPLAPPPIPGEAVYIPFVVDIALDGDLSDWAGVPTAVVDTGTMLSLDPAENGSFTFGVAADDEFLYVFATMRDATIITGQHGTNFWNEDSIEVYVNYSGDRFAESYGDGIFQMNLNPGDIGNTDATAITVTGTNSAASGVQASVFATDDGWGIEAAIPFGDYLTPEHGREIGFQIQANGASQLDRDVKLIWSSADTTDTSYNNPSLFGAGLFYEIGRTDVPVPSERAEAQEVETEAASAVAVNQVGYFTNGPKFAMMAASREPRTSWLLIDTATSEPVSAGTTSPGAFDAAANQMVWTADFSEFSTPGTYVIIINDTRSVPFVIADTLYDDLALDAMAYYYYNRSGIPILPEYAGEEWARPAGHLSDADVTCYAGTDADGTTWDGCDYRLNAAGGWYDAGDHGKYVVNGGISVWTLLNLFEQNPTAYADGALSIPENDNGVPDILDEVRWEMEFLLAMQVPEGQPLAGMVHHKLHDLQWEPVPWLPPTEVDNDDPVSGRYLMPPSTAATLNMAATAAQCARIYADFDAEFADRCLQAAQTAWQAALDHPDIYAGNTPGQGGGNYDDTNVADEFFWAAAELYITTGDSAYYDFLVDSPYFTQFDGLQIDKASAMFWGDTAALGTISLAMAPNGLSGDEVAALQGQIIATGDRYLETIANEGFRVPIGLSGYVWGSNSSVLNNALILGLAHRFTGDEAYLNGVIDAMDYVLGRNALARSFVSGYGTVSMENPHHRFWGNEPFNNFPPPPPGALAGGPNAIPSDPAAIEAVTDDMGPARRYIDDRGSYSTNEVTINWNAPLAWVAAYLTQQNPG